MEVERKKVVFFFLPDFLYNRVNVMNKKMRHLMRIFSKMGVKLTS